MKNMEIKWKKVKGHNGYYEVSNTGLVRSVERRVPLTRSYGKVVELTVRGKLLKKQVNVRDGYEYVWFSHRSRQKLCSVHRLVAEAFCKKPKGADCVNHIDFNIANNNADNLEWCTHKQNVEHTVKNGRHNIGERNGASKLNREKVREMRIEYEKGRKITELAKKYGVAHGTAYSVVMNETWKHV